MGITYFCFLFSDSLLGVNADGSVVVGRLTNQNAFIARVSSAGNGLITLDDVRASLDASAEIQASAGRAANLMINGAHSRPLFRRVATGQKALWLAGDWGRDSHHDRDGYLGLAEIGMGYNLGRVQLNVALGKTRTAQDTILNGKIDTDGHYIYVFAIAPLTTQQNLFATFGVYTHQGEADSRRGYLNAGNLDASTGNTDIKTSGVRIRLDWQNMFSAAKTRFSSYADLNYAKINMDAYTETGGGFPAHFNERDEEITELRVGLNGSTDLQAGRVQLISNIEAVHRFDTRGASTTGNLVGLFGFNLEGREYKQNWLKAGIGVEGKLAAGKASIMLNGTTEGESSNAWLAASWQIAF